MLDFRKVFNNTTSEEMTMEDFGFCGGCDDIPTPAVQPMLLNQWWFRSRKATVLTPPIGGGPNGGGRSAMGIPTSPHATNGRKAGSPVGVNPPFEGPGRPRRP